MALFLFDIDGTLIRPTGIGRRAFESALADLFGNSLDKKDLSFDGLLDEEIASRALVLLGFAPSASAVDRLLAVYLDHLKQSPPPDPKDILCPGIPAFMTEASARGHHLALLTGNIRRGAEVKLAMAGLEESFRGAEGDLLGAFGEDAPDRSSLVPVALARCEAAFGVHVEPSTAWIVGDSPRDVEAAGRSGVRCAAVATGLTPLQALESLGPDLALQDLSTPESLLSMAEGRRGR